MRYIVSGIRREGGPTSYVGANGGGFLTYSGAKAFVYNSEKEAAADLEYYQRIYSALAWAIEQLPPRLPLASAVLRARPVAGKLA